MRTHAQPAKTVEKGALAEAGAGLETKTGSAAATIIASDAVEGVALAGNAAGAVTCDATTGAFTATANANTASGQCAGGGG